MINQQYSTFFKELAKNNHKDWFHANKTTYEKEVKAPFLELLEALIPELRKWEPAISPNPKDALFRINRDIRFSKDKTPYNTILKAGFSAGGKKSELPGFYLGISADTIHVGGGLFMVKGDQLKNVRNSIADDPDAFLKIVEKPSFLSLFGELKGERAKRIDKDHQEAFAKTPYVANKQFYAMTDIPLADYLGSDELPKVLMSSFSEIYPLTDFLKKAL